MFLPGDEVALGEAYLYNDFDVEGNLETIYGAAERLLLDPPSWSQRLRLMRQLQLLPDESRRVTALQQLADDARGRARVSGRRHSVARDRQAVTYHYDVSNDFYRLWQDPPHGLLMRLFPVRG
jgi:cyclopropane-fatty-acyl-phospholipid synthase